MKIASHTRFALSQSFDEQGFDNAIIIENDLTLAPDGLSYFRSTAWLLKEDKTLFCVSAWNDNGLKGIASDERRLFRTDYFPGLGWMIRGETWNQIKELWPRSPTTGWDHWMRHGSGLHPRECIVPEVSRTHHYSEHGTNVNSGSAIAAVLEAMPLASLPPGKLGDLSYLLQPAYEAALQKRLQDATTINHVRARPPFKTSEAMYVLTYIREDFGSIADSLRLLHKNARTAHRGVVIVRDVVDKGLIALVDRRKGEGYLPADQLLRRHPSLLLNKAAPGESCDSFCRKGGRRCDGQQLEFANVCSELKKVFPCENGCGHQVGKEIPAYVHDRSKDTALQCLITDDEISTCSAGHPATTRLCACVPN